MGGVLTVYAQCGHAHAYVSAWLPFQIGVWRTSWTPLTHMTALLGLPSVGGCCPNDCRERQAVQAEDIPAFPVSPRWKIQSPPCLINSSTANRLSSLQESQRHTHQQQWPLMCPWWNYRLNPLSVPLQYLYVQSINMYQITGTVVMPLILQTELVQPHLHLDI